MMTRPFQRRWKSLTVIAVGVALLAGLLMPTGRQVLASVTLDYFRATWQPDLETIVIEWATATELNTVGFIVERSTAQDTGFVAITEVIPAVGDQLGGWTYDPVADDPLDLVLGTTYWYRLIVINTSPPNDVIDPVGVVAGDANTITPTNTATATVTRTPTHTPTRTRTPDGTTSTATATQQSSTTGPVVTPSVTFVSISGATVTPRPGQSPRSTATNAPTDATAVRTIAPGNQLPATTVPTVSAFDTPVPLAQNAQPTIDVPLPTATQPIARPTLVPTNSTIVAVAPIVVADEPAAQTEAAPGESNGLALVLIGAAGLLLLGGVYAILRQTNKPG